MAVEGVAELVATRAKLSGRWCIYCGAGVFYVTHACFVMNSAANGDIDSGVSYVRRGNLEF